MDKKIETIEQKKENNDFLFNEKRDLYLFEGTTYVLINKFF